MTHPPQKRDLTPFYMASVGLALLAVFFILHTLNWRTHTSFFSGTVSGSELSPFKALAYAGLYFCAWFIAPIYFLAAPLYWALFLRNKSVPADTERPLHPKP